MQITKCMSPLTKQVRGIRQHKLALILIPEYLFLGWHQYFRALDRVDYLEMKNQGLSPQSSHLSLARWYHHCCIFL